MLDEVHRLRKSAARFLVHTGKQPFRKGVLQLPPPGDDGLRFLGAEKLCLPAVALHSAPRQIPFPHEPIDIDGNEIRLDVPDLDNLTGVL